MRATKPDGDEEEQAFLETNPTHDAAIWSQKGHRRSATWYLRIALEVVMAVVIGLLLINPVHERINAKPSPVPQCMKPSRARDAKGRGYTQIADYERYEILGTPYTTSINRTADGPAFMLGVFHQLHCLSYLVDTWQKGWQHATNAAAAGGRRGDDAQQQQELTAEVAEHGAHCFDLLRQSIMCSADTNLEGASDEAGPGWGSRHVCTDYDAMLAWANEHAVNKWRNGLLPGEAIL
ncbi:hypothetical protein GGR56DRAFT_692104 [Xylariaceae sp. FL0804]|nr:hypothetical protein GGR56DRAFT_692104 [Xylariaceae sp. FL0804]